MAGPSGRACDPPKGMLVPAIHLFPCFSTASRGWPGQAGHDATATIPVLIPPLMDSALPVHRVVRDPFQGAPDRAVRENQQRVLGLLHEASGTIEGRLDRAMLGDQPQGVVQVLVGLFLGFDGPPPERLLLVVGGVE